MQGIQAFFLMAAEEKNLFFHIIDSFGCFTCMIIIAGGALRARLQFSLALAKE